MKITYIGHASILIEARGLAILSDPWWRGPCFGAQWWVYPFPHLSAVEARTIDYIYVSHGHHDHFHPATLSTFDRRTKILVETSLGLAAPIRRLGFEVIEVDDRQPAILGDGGISCRIMKTYGGDSLMTVDDGAEVCVNLNDALHSAPAAVQKAFIHRLKTYHPKIDYVFCGYGVASHFPNCYVIPDKNREATAAQRQRYFNRKWVGIIAELAPTYGFPFAADVVFLDKDLFWVNEVTHNSERPTNIFRELHPRSAVITKDISPGFVIESGVVIVDALRRPMVAAELRLQCAEQIERANRHGTVGEKGLNEIVGLLKKNLETCGGYLSSYDGDYRLLLRFNNSDGGIRIEKRGQQIEIALAPAASAEDYDLAYTTRLPYLKLALTQPFGDEILLVGSGGVFEYFCRNRAGANLHRELIGLIKNTKATPRSRENLRSKSVLGLKRLVKRMLGMTEADLYDLDAWTVYHDRQA